MLIHYTASKRVRDPATCRELYFGWTKLSGGSEHCCRKCNKSIRIHVGMAYCIPRCSYDKACSGVSGEIAAGSSLLRWLLAQQELNEINEYLTRCPNDDVFPAFRAS